MKNKPFSHFTGEFVGGTIAGFGVGVIVTNAFITTSAAHVIVPPFLWISAFLCTCVGGLIARSAYQKRVSKSIDNEKHDT